MSIKHYDWFFDIIHKSLSKYTWKVEENGALTISRIEDGKVVNIGTLSEEFGNGPPDFGVQGMATSRCLGPYSNHTSFSGELRAKIREITGVG